MNQINQDLFNMIASNDSGLYQDKAGMVITYTRFDFSNIDELVDHVGEDYFVNGHMKVELSATSIVVEMNSFIEGDGHTLEMYKEAWWQQDWERVFDDDLSSKSVS